MLENQVAFMIDHYPYFHLIFFFRSVFANIVCEKMRGDELCIMYPLPAHDGIIVEESGMIGPRLSVVFIVVCSKK
jgi:hypothetical protein